MDVLTIRAKVDDLGPKEPDEIEVSSRGEGGETDVVQDRDAAHRRGNSRAALAAAVPAAALAGEGGGPDPNAPVATR